MADSNPKGSAKETKSNRGRGGARSQLDAETYARLRAEAKAPYRGLRKFAYVGFGASGFIGATIFLSQLAAGTEVASTLPNLALQLGVVALMVWLFLLENRAERKSPPKS